MKRKKSPAKNSSPFDYDSLGPIEKIHHDLHGANVTAENFHHAEKFIRSCECVALWRLKQGQRPETASSHLAELAARIAHSIHRLTEAGDVMLARRLPPVVEIMQRAENVFGKKLTNKVTERVPIEKLLKKHRAIDLIQMFAALHPDWAEWCGVQNPQEFLKRPEKQLHRLLLSEETWTRTCDGVEFVEKRKHRLAELIERMQAIREMHQRNVNCFVEHLWRGRLWSGPNGTYEDCNWSTHPPRADVAAWMKLIVPHLKSITGNDAMKLSVFQYMIATRAYCHDGERFDAEHGTRLTAANPADIWNQVGAEIRKAWIRMAKQARKPVLKKPA